ncbi:MAG TPA: DUF1203 domain-containing protein [Gemmatimonadales bacterium]|nr:DUF1203 domain-containing protein [Gemmatimonadales bacterium]
MTAFRYAGITNAMADEVRQTRRSPQYGHPAHEELAKGTGPCRLCLRTFVVGEEDRILFTYQPFSEPGSLPAPGPVFIHAEACERYDSATLPDDFRKLPMVIEGYLSGGKLALQTRVNGKAAEELIAEAFAIPGVQYVHIRNGEAGCFMARVDREVGDG